MMYAVLKISEIGPGLNEVNITAFTCEDGRKSRWTSVFIN